MLQSDKYGDIDWHPEEIAATRKVAKELMEEVVEQEHIEKELIDSVKEVHSDVEVKALELIKKMKMSAKPKKKRKMNSEAKLRLFTLIMLFIPPVTIATVSAIHLVNYFSIGNAIGLSITLAIAFETLTLSAFISLRQFHVLSAFTRAAVWITIFGLAALQVLGNVFSVYIHINETLAIQASELMGITYGDGIFVKRVISIMLGSILPLTSLIFTKVLANFWYETSKKKARVKK